MNKTISLSALSVIVVTLFTLPLHSTANTPVLAASAGHQIEAKTSVRSMLAKASAQAHCMLQKVNPWLLASCGVGAGIGCMQAGLASIDPTMRAHLFEYLNAHAPGLTEQIPSSLTVYGALIMATAISAVSTRILECAKNTLERTVPAHGVLRTYIAGTLMDLLKISAIGALGYGALYGANELFVLGDIDFLKQQCEAHYFGNDYATWFAHHKDDSPEAFRNAFTDRCNTSKNPCQTYCENIRYDQREAHKNMWGTGWQADYEDDQAKWSKQDDYRRKHHSGEAPYDPPQTSDAELSNARGMFSLTENPACKAVREAYKTLMRQWHPDRNPGNIAEATTKTQEITGTYELLEKAYCQRTS
jgi:hypothetical protein